MTLYNCYYCEECGEQHCVNRPRERLVKYITSDITCLVCPKCWAKYVEEHKKERNNIMKEEQTIIWHDVTEELPETSGSYIAITKETWGEMHYDAVLGTWFMYRWSVPDMQPTHWTSINGKS